MPRQDGRKYRKPIFGIITWLALVGATGAAEPAVDPEDLRPGLLTTFREDTGASPLEIVQLEPVIALALKAGEAPHPRLKAEGTTVRWEGYVNILRPGLYRFSAQLRGTFRLNLAGKQVLDAEAHETDRSALAEGPEVRLKEGVQPLRAEFIRPTGMARLELFWQSPLFRREPLPYDQVGHLANQVPSRLATDREMEYGRFLAEERNCVGCHRPAEADKVPRGLVQRQGPDLSQVGQRVTQAWIYHWLESPQKVQPGAVMPRMFVDDEAGRTERYAVTRYLASLGGPGIPRSKPVDPKDHKASVTRGQNLFTTVGCIVCHRSADSEKKPPGTTANSYPHVVRTYPLSGLGSKTTLEKLAVYLANPLSVDPGGRMPNLVLQGNEAQDLARFLCESKDPDVGGDLPAAPGKDQSGDIQIVVLGRRLVSEKRCTQCHNLAEKGKSLEAVPARATFEDLQKPSVLSGGCLADRPTDPKSPWFDLSDFDRKCLRSFIREGSSGAGSPAPAFAGRASLQRFNCLGCHSRNGEGGLEPDLVEELRRHEKADNAEMISPPPLTGVGHKLRTSWLRQVLTQAGRARPWMGLRMPQFGEANVGHLPEELAALEGTDPDDGMHRVGLTAATIQVGRRLIGKQAFGCIACHDIAGIVGSGTRGPDLALMNQRVRYEWYRRWLEQAQRMQPGTRMPTVFPDGKSLLPDVLGGSADAQAEAMWAYLSLGPGLPLPEGLGPPKGLVITVKDRPFLLRSFMPEAGTRAVAVGFPGGISAVFDAATCRLAYAWSGNFLDASPVWNDRGGNPAKLLGPRFWNAPPGCPWGVSTSIAEPDFAGRSRDPSYGAALPEGQVFDGTRQLVFEGYAVDKEGVPTFHYRINAGEASPVEVSERAEPLHSPVAVGLRRHFTLAVPAQATSWMMAGESSQEPRILDAHGSPVLLDLKAGVGEVPAADRRLVLGQGGDRPVVLTLIQGPEGASWHLRRMGNTWQILLHLPAPAAAAQVQVGLDLWVPYRDDPDLLKDIPSGK